METKTIPLIPRTMKHVSPEFTFTEEEMKRIILEDDEQETGGTSHWDENLKEFCDEVFVSKHPCIEIINNQLKVCGIRQLDVLYEFGLNNTMHIHVNGLELFRGNFKPKRNFNSLRPCEIVYGYNIDCYWQKWQLVNLAGLNASKLLKQLNGKDLYETAQQKPLMPLTKAFVMMGRKGHYLVDTSDNTQISKPFNRGQGRLALIQFDYVSETIYINKCIWNCNDQKNFAFIQIPKSWKIKYVELGYPDYYSIKQLKNAKKWETKHTKE